MPGLYPFDRKAIRDVVPRGSGVYLIGYLCQGRLHPLYVGRSDTDGTSQRGSYGLYGRLLCHLRREDWLPFREKLTHFTYASIEDPEANFEAECWYFHRHTLRLNGGLGASLFSGHPHRPRHLPAVCSEPNCYHHHAEAAATMRAVWLHDNGRGSEGFYRQDWRTLRPRIAQAHWGYTTQPDQHFAGLLTPPLKKAVRLSKMNSGESYWRLFLRFEEIQKGLQDAPAGRPWAWPS